MPYKNYYIFTDGDSKEKCKVSQVKQRSKDFEHGWVTGKFSKYSQFSILTSSNPSILQRLNLKHSLRLKNRSKHYIIWSPTENYLVNLINFFEFCILIEYTCEHAHWVYSLSALIEFTHYYSQWVFSFNVLISILSEYTLLLCSRAYSVSILI